MKITTNQFKAVLLTNLLVVGLAACSSTPAPWSNPGASPWDGKHNADATSSVPADDTISQAPEVTAPAETLPAEPQAVEAPPAEASTMEPMPAAPAPEPAEPKSVVSDINNEQRVMALPGSYYAVQVYAASTLKSVEQYKSDKNLDDNMMAVKTDRNGKTIYVLVETYPNRSAAQAAASDIQSSTGSKPWVRSVAGLQKVVKQ